MQLIKLNFYDITHLRNAPLEIVDHYVITELCKFAIYVKQMF